MVEFDITDEHTRQVVGTGKLSINSRSINLAIDWGTGLISYIRLNQKSPTTLDTQLRYCWGLPRRYCVSLFDVLEREGIPSSDIEKRKIRPYANPASGA